MLAMLPAGCSGTSATGPAFAGTRCQPMQEAQISCTPALQAQPNTPSSGRISMNAPPMQQPHQSHAATPQPPPPPPPPPRRRASGSGNSKSSSAMSARQRQGKGQAGCTPTVMVIPWMTAGGNTSSIRAAGHVTAEQAAAAAAGAAATAARTAAAVGGAAAAATAGASTPPRRESFEQCSGSSMSSEPEFWARTTTGSTDMTAGLPVVIRKQSPQQQVAPMQLVQAQQQPRQQQMWQQHVADGVHTRSGSGSAMTASSHALLLSMTHEQLQPQQIFEQLRTQQQQQQQQPLGVAGMQQLAGVLSHADMQSPAQSACLDMHSATAGSSSPFGMRCSFDNSTTTSAGSSRVLSTATMRQTFLQHQQEVAATKQQPQSNSMDTSSSSLRTFLLSPAQAGASISQQQYSVNSSMDLGSSQLFAMQPQCGALAAAAPAACGGSGSISPLLPDRTLHQQQPAPQQQQQQQQPPNDAALDILDQELTRLLLLRQQLGANLQRATGISVANSAAAVVGSTSVQLRHSSPQVMANNAISSFTGAALHAASPLAAPQLFGQQQSAGMFAAPSNVGAVPVPPGGVSPPQPSPIAVLAQQQQQHAQLLLQQQECGGSQLAAATGMQAGVLTAQQQAGNLTGGQAGVLTGLPVPVHAGQQLQNMRDNEQELHAELMQFLPM